MVHLPSIKGDTVPYTIQYKNEYSIVIVNYTGTVTDDDLLNAYSDVVFSEEQIMKLKYTISDFSKTDHYLITSECIKEQAEMAVGISKINPNINVLIVAPQDIAFGSGRMWMAYSVDAGWNVQIFRSTNELIQWMSGNK